MSKPKHKFVIRYKSGAEVRVRADELAVAWDTARGVATEMKWNNMRPRPLAIALANVESVWQVA